MAPTKHSPFRINRNQANFLDVGDPVLPIVKELPHHSQTPALLDSHRPGQELIPAQLDLQHWYGCPAPIPLSQSLSKEKYFLHPLFPNLPLRDAIKLGLAVPAPAECGSQPTPSKHGQTNTTKAWREENDSDADSVVSIDVLRLNKPENTRRILRPKRSLGSLIGYLTPTAKRSQSDTFLNKLTPRSQKQETHTLILENSESYKSVRTQSSQTHSPSTNRTESQETLEPGTMRRRLKNAFSRTGLRGLAKSSEPVPQPDPRPDSQENDQPPEQPQPEQPQPEPVPVVHNFKYKLNAKASSPTLGSADIHRSMFQDDEDSQDHASIDDIRRGQTTSQRSAMFQDSNNLNAGNDNPTFQLAAARVSPMEYARAYYLDEAQANSERRPHHIPKPVLHHHHTNRHNEFLVVPEIPDNVRPCIPQPIQSGNRQIVFPSGEPHQEPRRPSQLHGKGEKGVEDETKMGFTHDYLSPRRHLEDVFSSDWEERAERKKAVNAYGETRDAQKMLKISTKTVSERPRDTHVLPELVFTNEDKQLESIFNTGPEFTQGNSAFMGDTPAVSPLRLRSDGPVSSQGSEKDNKEAKRKPSRPNLHRYKLIPSIEPVPNIPLPPLPHAKSASHQGGSAKTNKGGISQGWPSQISTSNPDLPMTPQRRAQNEEAGYEQDATSSLSRSRFERDLYTPERQVSQGSLSASTPSDYISRGTVSTRGDPSSSPLPAHLREDQLYSPKPIQRKAGMSNLFARGDLDRIGEEGPSLSAPTAPVTQTSNTAKGITSPLDNLVTTIHLAGERGVGISMPRRRPVAPGAADQLVASDAGETLEGSGLLSTYDVSLPTCPSPEQQPRLSNSDLPSSEALEAQIISALNTAAGRGNSQTYTTTSPTTSSHQRNILPAPHHTSSPNTGTRLVKNPSTPSNVEGTIDSTASGSAPGGRNRPIHISAAYANPSSSTHPHHPSQPSPPSSHAVAESRRSGPDQSARQDFRSGSRATEEFSRNILENLGHSLAGPYHHATRTPDSRQATPRIRVSSIPVDGLQVVIYNPDPSSRAQDSPFPLVDPSVDLIPNLLPSDITRGHDGVFRVVKDESAGLSGVINPRRPGSLPNRPHWDVVVVQDFSLPPGRDSVPSLSSSTTGHSSPQQGWPEEDEDRVGLAGSTFYPDVSEYPYAPPNTPVTGETSSRTRISPLARHLGAFSSDLDVFFAPEVNNSIPINTAAARAAGAAAIARAEAEEKRKARKKRRDALLLSGVVGATDLRLGDNRKGDLSSGISLLRSDPYPPTSSPQAAHVQADVHDPPATCSPSPGGGAEEEAEMRRLKKASSKLKSAVTRRDEKEEGQGRQPATSPGESSSAALPRVPDLDGAVLGSVAPRHRGARRAWPKEDEDAAAAAAVLATPGEVVRLVRDEILRQEERPVPLQDRSYGRVLEMQGRGGIRSREEMAEFVTVEVGRLHLAPSDFMSRRQVEEGRAATQSRVVASVLAALVAPAASTSVPVSAVAAAAAADPSAPAPAPTAEAAAAARVPALTPWLYESRDPEREARRLADKERKLEKKKK
ncbi:hypothetical protein F5X99DRAFT_431303 [Biscogniauxia marginata]|nr:hypothetical protein F5X99DRAFT_431303 [Biscogniauxia marginata]